MTTPPPEKLIGELIARFNELWSKGGVKIAVNATAPGVGLPDHIIARHPSTTAVLQQADGSETKMNMTILVLHYPLHPVVPIHDLRIDEKGISATLSFDRSPHKTMIPWTAVLNMASLYDEPDEGEEPTPVPPPRRGHLRSLP
jgi:hypothetical protein